MRISLLPLSTSSSPLVLRCLYVFPLTVAAVVASTAIPVTTPFTVVLFFPLGQDVFSATLSRVTCT